MHLIGKLTVSFLLVGYLLFILTGFLLRTKPKSKLMAVGISFSFILISMVFARVIIWIWSI